LGVTAALTSFVFGLYLLAKKLLFGIPLLGYTSLMVSIYFLGGIVLMVLGVIGEYIGRIYEEVQGRPLYLIKDRII
jgi:hypothetical protein